MVFFQSILSDGDSITVYCPTNEVYSELFGDDNCELPDPNVSTTTWINEELYT